MRLPAVFLSSFLIFLAHVTASPAPGDRHGHSDHHHRHDCLTDAEANQIATIWENFYSDPSTLSNAQLVDTYLAEDLQVFSDSINWVTPGADHTVWPY